MNKAYIAFGSNIGDRHKAVEDAFVMIEQRGMRITAKSKMYETEPYGYTDQPPFLNGAIEVETHLNCRETLKALLDIENDIGRVRLIRWGPRIIDLDILMFNDEVHDEEDLKVPHTDMVNRQFVLEPLNDICPDKIHPLLNVTIRDLLENLKK
ncbi:2-amino-4-hydroxy-6-hydroxymethyldihydropteridine diphosphokinase [Clostridium cylindrosporum]|uniref:2-amino-4-hydroxy-6-hydroxymethyldihydropteridine diphosphokinase n=1 Tax=Clostridium cylindrosporum DSM 605 TaxID=1121307 RepID=A0A0J8D4Z8_CLOCY|nr:2-amino-4-hydroxy-6-hydroxymethyldihydropteridine diphosphokinase [Clostridium cylindrosporum]KMT20892.1 bifunctional folate synthesis protein [Clostridium cylindrosporum DSM 605]